MKKTAAGFAFAAVIGISAMSATPAMALTPTGQFENCSEAAASGVYNIPASDPRYGAHLDSDLDGFGCENADAGAPEAPVADPAAPVENVAPAPQIVQVPVGAPATGASQQTSDSTGFLVAGGALFVAAAAASVTLAKRKSAEA
ncbi:excalibur calcium-binding domain-containing protein [Arthrobacter sp. zg-Y40]|uniref:excalibur calcium-binding domain-containing protein n=1 Tax=Arthrobacter sp. zg-Y40 TaxID=2886939 RepID=UPI001D15C82E|nr:excalibur calcium-binding domain-containing protein [Arthrobacter sp. zg-Y40]MCC3279874.1 excalibur calcium-binding domain-containing protein [Arthrobacter sp. zg-Y40]